ncbi:MULTISPECIES: peptide MFS transporter [Psychrilyobacter]|uniref:MFS transporter n=2 Tax=Psychrilyobacter TaxID=623282 RepID=A0ABX9KEP7_9FUSO|nr:MULTISPECIES: peptide MFS transporter [Psychrilyobacter]MCS5422744.1 peptide MFS transporter [Psychrilyobacter sp. S5]NDI78703.1 peptide MFS transporter [Psychrilyobacter piezotolerans]RDE59878.1 MFS transporter [Psychrilyobacter sp. S5]REI40159.1 MFS transporter [Psychrilyobacter piezotolerans]
MTTVMAEKEGHPKGFWLMCFTILWERFSYYGMTAILVLFFTANLTQGGLGMDVKTATSLFGFFTGFIYLTPIIGGWLADNYLGQQKCIFIGCVLIGTGDLILFGSQSRMTLYMALITIIIGNGFFKASGTNIIGNLYPKEDTARKDAAYSLQYTAVNLGAFLAPLIIGLVADNLFSVVGRDGAIIFYGYKTAFAFCGGGILVGAFVFKMLAPRYLKEVGRDPIAHSYRGKDGRVIKEPLTKDEKNKVSALLIICVFVTVFWTAFNQSYTSFALYARDFVDRSVGEFDIPVPWFTSLNSILCVTIAPILGIIWIKLSKTKKGDLSIPVKMSLGMLLMSLGFGIMVLSVFSTNGTSDPGVKAGLVFITGTYFFNTVGELCLSPVGNAMVNRLAPAKYTTLFMGLWFLTNFFASIFSGIIAGFTQNFGFSTIFSGIGILLFIMSVSLFWMRKPLLRLMGEEEREVVLKKA